MKGFLFSKGFEMGKVDKTLLRQGDDILIVMCMWIILSLETRLTLWL
jgi:hypothetical protein